MISENAFFIKDIFGPKGSLSIMAKTAGGKGKSSSIEAHTQTESLLLHHAELNENEEIAKEDEWIDLSDEPDHNELCKREQEYFLAAIINDQDLNHDAEDAVDSLQIGRAHD